MSQTAIDILVPALCGAAAGSAIAAGFHRARINRLERKVRTLEIIQAAEELPALQLEETKAELRRRIAAYRAEEQADSDQEQ